MIDDVALWLLACALILLCVSHWLIWSRLDKINSRLETQELDAIHNMKISGEHSIRLNDLEIRHAKDIRDRGNSKNNTSPRIYGVD
jgi:ABC-type nickel/cobalt efflux system permease component RcnA